MLQDMFTTGGRLATVSNDCQVVNVIRRHGPVSRAEIAKATGLTPPTVTNIAAKLLDLGLVSEYMIGESSGGRRPVLLKINPEAGQLAVINIRSEKMVAYLVDPELKIHRQETRRIKGKGREEVLSLMLEMLAACREAATAPVLAMGVVIRGPVRSQEGISVFAPNIGWRNVPLKYIIEEKLRVPAFIENDSRALTNGEYYYGAAKDAHSMVLLKVGHGIGAGIMFNGRLYRGANDSAGEIGHTTLDIAGPVCSCGNYGCLEALASEYALVDMVVKAVKEGHKSLILTRTAGGDLTAVTPEDIYQAADEGDEVCRQMLGRVGRYLGIGIANLVNLLNPELFVIAGGIVKGRNYIEDIIRQTVAERSFESCSGILEIRFSTEATESTLKGVADMIFAEVADAVWLGPR